MEYGLRRYEAAQRLFWLLFFILCLAIAYPAANAYTVKLQQIATAGVDLAAQAQSMTSKSFWLQRNWITAQPFGWYSAYLAWAAVLFLGGKVLWLLLQYVGKFLSTHLLSTTIKGNRSRPSPAIDDLTVSPERYFPADLLLSKVDHFIPQILFHPYKRLRLLLSNPHGMISSEELVEKERRISETDWGILQGSWTPFGWLLWFLPPLGFAESARQLFLHVQPAITQQQEIQGIISGIPVTFVPLVQLIVITVGFRLAAAVLKRVEDLYLSNVDALFYDRLLSRLPFHSGDTVIILDALKRHFKEIRDLLRRIERAGNDRGPMGT